METNKDFFMLEGEYDSKHINNLSEERVPMALLDAVEDGCSIETLEQLAGKRFPICKYKTQITIHGVFPETSTKRIGMYVNMVQNKNKSIGVRWTAIDHDKKHLLYAALTHDSEWHSHEDSQSYVLQKSQLLPRGDKEAAQAIVDAYRKEADGIDRSLFRGYAHCFVTEVWGRFYVVLEVNVQCFYQKNFEALYRNLSGGRDYQQTLASMEDKRLRDEERRRKEHEEYERREREAEQRKEEERMAFLKECPMPEGFAEEERVPEDGDVVVHLKYNRFACAFAGEKRWEWRYYGYKKHAGRLMCYPSDAEGNKKEKGSYIDPVKQKLCFKVRERKQVPVTQTIAKMVFRSISATKFAIGGETYVHRKRIKELGGKWSGKTKEWLFDGKDMRQVQELVMM